MSTREEIRAYLLDELQKDFIGPSRLDEELTDPPVSHYMAGILFPPETMVDPEQDEEANEAPLDDDEMDPGTLMAAAFNPSAIGLTFSVSRGETLQISVSTATYTPIRSDDPDDKGTIWQRKQISPDPVILKTDEPGTAGFDLKDGLKLYTRKRLRGTRMIITVSLLNDHDVSGLRTRLDEYCFFQPELTVTATGEGKPVFLTRPREDISLDDPDRELNRLLYRYSVEFAVGHGCAAEWEADEGENAVLIRTALMPEFEVLQLSPDWMDPVEAQTMRFLSEATDGSLIPALKEFNTRYLNWIREIQEEVPDLPEALQNVARENLDACREAVSRINQGILEIETDPIIRQAFQLANRAMLIQRSRIEWMRFPEEERLSVPKLTDSHQWRAFQLAFILLCIPSIADPQSRYRDIVDLLWFPTGGGKTEAYLGLTAFTIFLRRLRADGEDQGAGVTVLMRYTLRLLTIQQFQRAASLIMACEHIRREKVSELGNQEISLGLWVGGGATPNWLANAREALRDLLNGEQVFEGNPYQVLSCPWCGTDLTPRHYHINGSLSIECPNEGCDFHSGMPLYLIDEDIYRRRPSLLIGTVDKFARLPWLEQTSSLFGRLPPGHLPPELVIQDELHLITGPLGTLTGIYETAIDILSSQNGIGPKVIASTATIRRAGAQVEGLFARELRQFPPPGLDARDSYFARQVSPKQRPGRLFVGVHTPGKSMKTTLLRVYALLLQRIAEHRSDPELRDPYWTLVGYFNSLRELGGAVRLVDDDIRARIKVLARRRGEEIREINLSEELTSRVSSDRIPEILELMNSDSSSSQAIDVLLATNMISVGVDVDRLGLMVVNGQPKMTSEYIQATSRIGRRYPGLVIALYNWTRPRDRSHYERFIGYHAALYSQVEASSVTPFSSRARDRALHGVFITLMRHLHPDLRPDDSARSFDPESPEAREVMELIRNRVARVDPGEADETMDQLNQIARRWGRFARADVLYYTKQRNRPEAGFLLIGAEEGIGRETRQFPTLNSLREVEGESVLYIEEETEA